VGCFDIAVPRFISCRHGRAGRGLLSAEWTRQPAYRSRLALVPPTSTRSIYARERHRASISLTISGLSAGADSLKPTTKALRGRQRPGAGTDEKPGSRRASNAAAPRVPAPAFKGGTECPK